MNKLGDKAMITYTCPNCENKFGFEDEPTARFHLSRGVCEYCGCSIPKDAFNLCVGLIETAHISQLRAKSNNHARNLSIPIVFLLVLTFLSTISHAQNTTAPTNIQVSIPAFAPQGIMDGIVSLYTEFVSYNANYARQLLKDTQVRYSLSDFPFGLPILGAMFIGIWLVLNLHWGMFLFILLHVGIFAIVIVFLFNLILANTGLGDWLFAMCFGQKWMYDTFVGIISALLALGLTVFFAGG